MQNWLHAFNADRSNTFFAKNLSAFPQCEETKGNHNRNEIDLLKRTDEDISTIVKIMHCNLRLFSLTRFSYRIDKHELIQTSLYF